MGRNRKPLPLSLAECSPNRRDAGCSESFSGSQNYPQVGSCKTPQNRDCVGIYYELCRFPHRTSRNLHVYPSLARTVYCALLQSKYSPSTLPRIWMWRILIGSFSHRTHHHSKKGHSKQRYWYQTDTPISVMTLIFIRLSVRHCTQCPQATYLWTSMYVCVRDYTKWTIMWLINVVNRPWSPNIAQTVQLSGFNTAW